MAEKTTVAIVIYDRIQNLKTWLKCWEQCDKAGAKLVIIHNVDKDFNPEFERICKEHSVKYIQRKNVGYDVGAFHDVCKERLPGFDNDWDNLLWIIDDHLPMSKYFVQDFLNALALPKAGVSCMEISDEVKPHIRTGGFCIKKWISKRLSFDVERITTKEDCFNFEHRSKNAFLEQIKRMGLTAVMVNKDLAKSPLWDTDYRAYLNRVTEFNNLFKMKKVTFICPIYNSFPEIISSLINQTHHTWELILVHDGKNETGLKALIDIINDSRITYIETPERKGNWGHYYRQFYLNEIKEGRIAPDTEYIVISNADNHHVPVYCEYLLNGFIKNPDAVAVYCSQMVHGYMSNQQINSFTELQPSSDLKWDTYRWGIINCRLQLGYIDCGCVMIRKDAACEVGWRDIETHSSDWTYFEDVIKKFGPEKWVKVAGALFVHN